MAAKTATARLCATLTAGSSPRRQLRGSATTSVRASLLPPPMAHAAAGEDQRATATIAGCVDDGIRGTMKLKEKASDQGVKQIEVKLEMEGMTPGRRGEEFPFPQRHY